jgi:hypothetical protein
MGAMANERVAAARGAMSSPASPIALETTMNPRTSGTATFPLWVAALIATVAFEASAGERIGKPTDRDRPVGVFTGRFANGMPIYQLPSVTVVADRKAELARIEEESARARALSRKARRTAAGDVHPGGV